MRVCRPSVKLTYPSWCHTAAETTRTADRASPARRYVARDAHMQAQMVAVVHSGCDGWGRREGEGTVRGVTLVMSRRCERVSDAPRW
jgi:hypothetical protein